MIKTDEILQGGSLDAASAAEALGSPKTEKSNELREWLGPNKTKHMERFVLGLGLGSVSEFVEF